MIRSLAAAAGLVAATLGAVSTPAAAQPKENDHIYGPEPTWEEFRALAEADIRSSLIDPESARFAWAGSHFKGELKIVLGARTQGYVGCGTVNAKNRMGGYVGATPFAVVIDYGRVLYSKMDRTVDYECSRLQQEGRFPRIAANGPLAGMPSANVSGLSLRPMPDGAYVSAVAPGSAAEAAGLKPGMVITSINAIPLAGLDAAMIKLIDAAGPTATLAIVGGTTFKLGAKP